MTDAGSSFLAYARKTVALAEDMRRGLADRRLTGRVRVGLFEDRAFTRLPAALADFRRKHPHVKIELISFYSKELPQSLKEGLADLVVADSARFTEPPKSLISRRLVWCASRLTDLDEGRSLPIILFDTQCSWLNRMLSDLAENGIDWHVGCKVKTLPAMLSALRAGLGIGLLFPEAVPMDCELIDGKHGLPNAPAAEFGVFLGEDASQHVQELALFFTAGLLIDRFYEITGRWFESAQDPRAASLSISSIELNAYTADNTVKRSCQVARRSTSKAKPSGTSRP